MRRPLAAALALLLSLLALAAPSRADHAAQAAVPHWQHVDVRSQQQFRGLDVIDAKTAWVSGSAGGVWLTTDGGKNWRKSMPAGAKAVYRDVEATDALHAQVLAIGTGIGSRIYQTADGGKSWQVRFVNHDKKAFYDCLAMYPDGRHGLAMSDPVFGKFRIISTSDGGATWRRVPPKGMPEAVKGEFGFAASGTCLVTVGSTAYLASGGSAARVFVSYDRGVTWTAKNSTLPHDPAGGGVFSLAFRTPALGLAVGGDFNAPTVGTDASAFTTDGGKSWTNGGDLGGYRSGVAWVGPQVAIAVGPSGTDITRDAGHHWTTFSTEDFDAVQCVAGSCWASGPKGVVARLVD